MKRKIFISIAVVIIVLATFFPVHLERSNFYNGLFQLGQGGYRITIGNLVGASDADYTCDGTDDNEQFQAALDALPTQGGQIFVVDVGNYTWADEETVTRAIDNVTIIGVGAGVNITGDGVTALFATGGDNWLFSNLRLDAGGLNMGSTSDWMKLHVIEGATYYPLQTDNINIMDHSSLHGVGGADTIFPADPDADKYLMWDDDPGQLSWEDGGGIGDMDKATYDTDDDGDIDTAAGGTEWDSSAATGVVTIVAGAWGTTDTGISNQFIMIVDDADAAASDIPYFTASGLAGYNEAEFKSAYNMEAGTDYQAYDAELAALAGLTSVSDKMIYFTGSGTAATSDFTAFARSILDDANEATFKATVNLEIGTDVLAQQTIGIADDNLLEVDGDPNSGEVAFFTANGLAGQSEVEFKATFNLEIGVDIQAWDDDLDDIAALTPTDGYIMVGDGTDWTARTITNGDIANSVGGAVVILTSPTEYHGLCVRLVPIGDGEEQLLIWREASQHGYDGDSVLKAANTYDLGVTLSNERTIYSEANCDTRNFAARQMDDGRIGIFAFRYDTSGSAWSDPVFIYSDDDGDTWDSDVLTSLPDLSEAYWMYRYPTSVGGDDDGGWILYADVVTNVIYWIATTDNGDNWSYGTALTAGAGEKPLEVSVARIRSEDKWIMVARPEDGYSGIGQASKSTDMKTWSAFTSIGQEIGKNPLQLYSFDDYIQIIAFSRGPDRFITGFPDGVVSQIANADDLWDDLTDWPGWELLSGGHYRTVGYSDINTIWGKPVMHFNIEPKYPDTSVCTVAVMGAFSPTISQGVFMQANIDGSRLSQDFGASSSRLLNYVPTPLSGYALFIADCAGGAFAGDIDAAGSGGLTATNVPYDGDSNEDFFNGLAAYDGSNYWGQLVLHNTDKGNSRKIVDVDTATDVIMTTSSTDDWADNDAITCQSQVNTTSGYVDIDLSDSVASTTAVLYFSVYFQNKVASNDDQNVMYVHPYESYDIGKQQTVRANLASMITQVPMIMSIVDQKMTIRVRTDGTGDFAIFFVVSGYYEYADTP